MSAVPSSRPRASPRRAPARGASRAVLAAAMLSALAALGWVGYRLSSGHEPLLVPRHRAEALCFALARPPAFAPEIRVECSAAMVRGRFSQRTPAATAIQQSMRFTDDMRLWQGRSRVGDYEVVTTWLRLPDRRGARHWLVAGWMEGADLAMCSFAFPGDDATVSHQERIWGDRLLRRILVPENFRSGALPEVRWRAPRKGSLPVFGPPGG